MTNSSIKLIGENIRKYRKIKDFSQEKLSEMVNVTPDYISLIELGKRIPSLKRLYKIAEILEVEPYKLLKYEENLSG